MGIPNVKPSFVTHNFDASPKPFAFHPVPYQEYLRQKGPKASAFLLTRGQKVWVTLLSMAFIPYFTLYAINSRRMYLRLKANIDDYKRQGGFLELPAGYLTKLENEAGRS